jgi:aryl-alcohol dehydrogenase-like predicted oxidoreductase
VCDSERRALSESAGIPFVTRPGTRNIAHLNENLGAINVQPTPAHLREIDAAVSKIKVHGGRMNEEQMKVVDQTA